MTIAGLLVDRLGPDRVLTDAGDLDYYSMDIYSVGSRPVAVVLPRSTAELQETVRTITESGGVIVPRGGGVSYTGGVVPTSPNSVVVDTSQMNRILEVSSDDMYVTVEAGCSWGVLRQRLASDGLRTPFWGPLSGNYATVGGTVSQGAVLWGSARFGTSSESVVGLEVVLADGSLLTTGMGAVTGGHQGWRHFGPDLTGPFLGDSGALGVKATVTLRLMQEPEEVGFASYSFEHRQNLLDSMTALARSGAVVTGFALDPVLTDQRIRRGSIAQGAGAALSMISSSSNKLRAVRDAARMAAHGRTFAGTNGFTLHLVAEARTTAALEADMEVIRRLCSRGQEIDDTVPRLLHARPFGSLTAALGPEGQRWSPLHVVVPLSRGTAVWDAAATFLEQHAAEMEKYEVEVGVMTSTVSTTSLLLEFVMVWPGPRTMFYERKVEEAKLRRYPEYEYSPEAVDLIARLRDGLINLFDELSGAHFQIGRRYSYLNRLEPATRSLIEAVKGAVDPRNVVNPGVLGFPEGSPTQTSTPRLSP